MKYGYAHVKFLISNTFNKVKNQVYSMPYGISTLHYFKKIMQNDIWAKLPRIIDNSLLHSVGFSYLCEIGVNFLPGFSTLNEFKYMMTGFVFLIAAYHQYEEAREDTNDKAEKVIEKATEVSVVSEEIFFKDAELFKQAGYTIDEDVHKIEVLANENSKDQEPEDQKESDSYVNTLFEVVIKTLNIISLPVFYSPCPPFIKDTILFLTSIMVILSSYDNGEYHAQQIKKHNLLRDKMLRVKNDVYELQKKFGTEQELNKLLQFAESMTGQMITIEPLIPEIAWKNSDIANFFELSSMQWFSALLKGSAMGKGLAMLMQFFLKNILPLQYFICLIYVLKKTYDFHQQESSHIHFRHELSQFYSELIDIQNKKLLPAKAILGAQTEYLSLEDTSECRIKILEPESSHVMIDIPNDFDELLEYSESAIPSVKERGTILFFRSAKKENMSDSTRRIECRSSV